MSKHTNASSREPTGGLIRREGATGLERSGSAERGNGPQSRDWRNLPRETCQSLAALRTQEESRKRHAWRRAAQKEHAAMAWFCSNPERDDRVTSTTSNCNTASPVRASSRHRSQMHRPRERLPVPQEKLALPNASLTNLDAQGLRVKQARDSKHELMDASRPVHFGCMVGKQEVIWSLPVCPSLNRNRQQASTNSEIAPRSL